MFIKVKELKRLLNSAPDDSYIVLYDAVDEGDTFLEEFDVRTAHLGSGYCQGSSLVKSAIDNGKLDSETPIVVLSGRKKRL